MIITVGNQKGGVAKTTVASMLSAGLQRKRKKTLLIDFDPQCTLTDQTLQEHNKHIGHLLDGEPAETVVTKTKEFGDIIAGTASLIGLDQVLIMNEVKGMNKAFILKEALEPIRNKYDFIIIDTPPAFSLLSENALSASDEVIIPVTAEMASYRGLNEYIRTVEYIQKHINGKLKVNGILINRIQGKTILGQSMIENLEEFAETKGIYTYKAKIREGVALKEASFLGKDIFTYSPRSNQAKDFQSFVDEFIKHTKGGQTK